MILARPSDLLTVAHASGLQFVYADVTDAARGLEASHLSGPVASLVLGEALAGVALLGAELDRPHETVTLRMCAAGPVQSVLVEAAQDGGLRGYTQVKIFDDLDGREDAGAAAGLGEQAQVQIVRSLPGRIVSHADLEVRPAEVRLALERYCAKNGQPLARACVLAGLYNNALDMARGFLVRALPDADVEAFGRLAALFDDDTVAEELEACASLSELAETLGLAELKAGLVRPLHFACRCSRPRVMALLAALSAGELEQMAQGAAPTAVHCHMCGKAYEVGAADMRRIMQQRKGTV